MPSYDYKCSSCGVIDISHGMTEEDKTVCPECQRSGLIKMISAGSGIIISGREANQYTDIKAAKYWRDKNGVRHPVTASDGYSTSSTVKRQTETPDNVKGKIKKSRKEVSKERIKLTSDRAKIWNKEQVKKASSWGDGTVTSDDQ